MAAVFLAISVSIDVDDAVETGWATDALFDYLLPLVGLAPLGAAATLVLVGGVTGHASHRTRPNRARRRRNNGHSSAVRPSHRRSSTS